MSMSPEKHELVPYCAPTKLYEPPGFPPAEIVISSLPPRCTMFAPVPFRRMFHVAPSTIGAAKVSTMCTGPLGVVVAGGAGVVATGWVATFGAVVVGTATGTAAACVVVGDGAAARAGDGDGAAVVAT